MEKDHKMRLDYTKCCWKTSHMFVKIWTRYAEFIKNLMEIDKDDQKVNWSSRRESIPSDISAYTNKCTQRILKRSKAKLCEVLKRTDMLEEGQDSGTGYERWHFFLVLSPFLLVILKFHRRYHMISAMTKIVEKLVKKSVKKISRKIKKK